jgi:uncharacterized membrane protein
MDSMTYNLHPIFVHFPIALLFLYSIIKVLPLQKWVPSVGWRDIERVLLVVGVLGAFTALATGDAAEHLARPSRQLVGAHANFASIATFIYGALLAGEIAAVINAQSIVYGKKWQWVSTILRFIETLLCNHMVSFILAIVGFVAISITGMLGGVMAYGVSADPLSPLLLKLLGITL